MRISILAILLLLPTLACAQITASLNYDKQKDVLELIVGNESRDSTLAVFDLYGGTAYSSTVRVRYGKIGERDKDFVVRLREEQRGIMEIAPLQTKSITCAWFTRLRARGYRFFEVSYDVVYAFRDSLKVGKLKSCKGKLKFEVEEP